MLLDFPLPFIFSHLQLDTAMAKQNNQSITIIQEEDELVLPDKIVYPLQGAKTKEKTDEQPLRKYTPKPPINSQNTQPVTMIMLILFARIAREKDVRPTISATLPGRPPPGYLHLLLNQSQIQYRCRLVFSVRQFQYRLTMKRLVSTQTLCSTK